MKANVNVRDSTHSDQRNFEKLGAPSDRSHWPDAQMHCTRESEAVSKSTRTVRIGCCRFSSESLLKTCLEEQRDGMKPSGIVPFPLWCTAFFKAKIL
jgi:hypothetical protein